MKIIHRVWEDTRRGDTWRLYPLGDIHLGNRACHENQFRRVVKEIEGNDRAYWVGLGDYADFINMRDPRFSSDSLASWVKMAHLGDLAKAQRDRFLEIVSPIAGQCLGLIAGNHEDTIKRFYERDIYSEIVMGVKEAAGFDADRQLAFGYSGWLILRFRRSGKGGHGGTTTLRLNLHHGFVGGKLAGAKALNMQRWLWNHDADLVIFGHSHNTAVQVEAIERVRGNKVIYDNRIGMYSGTFMNGADYAERKGYFPVPATQPHVILTPGAVHQANRIKVVT